MRPIQIQKERSTQVLMVEFTEGTNTTRGWGCNCASYLDQQHAARPVLLSIVWHVEEAADQQLQFPCQGVEPFSIGNVSAHVRQGTYRYKRAQHVQCTTGGTPDGGAGCARTEAGEKL